VIVPPGGCAQEVLAPISRDAHIVCLPAYDARRIDVFRRCEICRQTRDMEVVICHMAREISICSDIHLSLMIQKTLAALVAVLGLMVVMCGCVTTETTKVADVVEILDYEIVPLDRYTVGVEGHVKNNYDERFTALGIAVKFYDADGIMIGDGKTIIENLDPGETALFTVRYYGSGYPETAKISEIRGKV